MFVDHLAHPAGLAAKVGIGGARANAGGDKFAAVKLVGADGGEHDLGALCHRIEARGVAGVRDDQRRVLRGTDDVAHLGKRSEEHTSELQSLMRISYAVFCWKKKKNLQLQNTTHFT